MGQSENFTVSGTFKSERHGGLVVSGATVTGHVCPYDEQNIPKCTRMNFYDVMRIE
jgi:hypothetical protein